MTKYGGTHREPKEDGNGNLCVPAVAVVNPLKCRLLTRSSAVTEVVEGLWQLADDLSPCTGCSDPSGRSL